MSVRRLPPTGDPALKTQARRLLREQVKKLGLPCARCGGPIDYQAKAGPWSYHLGEIIPRALGGSPTDPANVQPEHAHCSVKAGAKLGARRRWGKPRRARRSAIWS